MFWDIVFWGIILVFVIGFAHGMGKDFGDGLGYFMGGIIGLVVGGIISCVLIGVVAWNSQAVEERKIPLQSLQTDRAIAGEFSSGLFVGYGYIQQSPVYYFYGVNPNGSKTLASVWAGDSEVIEQSKDKKPYAKCYRKVTKHPDIFGIADGPWYNANSAQWCTFYVPEGSVNNTVDPNLKLGEGS